MADKPSEAGVIGYRRPPTTHQFRKGKSGNPKGRPKGSKNQVPEASGLDFGTQPANRMLLEEAYRTISVREGDKVIELPMIKAVFRALGMSAMKGNRLAQSAMAELVRGIEDEDRKLRVDHFAEACGYKRDWEQAIEDARQRGVAEPMPIPHPADVIIDTRRAEVRYEGPMTPEEKLTWDRMLEFRDEQQDFVSLAARAYRACDEINAEGRSRRLETWRIAQRTFDRVNEPLPRRYKKVLVDRCNVTGCQPARDPDPLSASKIDPTARRDRAVVRTRSGMGV